MVTVPIVEFGQSFLNYWMPVYGDSSVLMWAVIRSDRKLFDFKYLDDVVQLGKDWSKLQDFLGRPYDSADMCRMRCAPPKCTKPLQDPTGPKPNPDLGGEELCEVGRFSYSYAGWSVSAHNGWGMDRSRQLMTWQKGMKILISGLARRGTHRIPGWDSWGPVKPGLEKVTGIGQRRSQWCYSIQNLSSRSFFNLLFIFE